MSSADISVIINGKREPEEVAYDIMQVLRAAAADAIETAAEDHIKTAKQNVEKAYVLGEQKISILYAYSLIPKELSESLTPDERRVEAVRIRDTREGMVLTGNLLNKISVGALTTEGEVIAIELLSMAPYSRNLEWGILFGKGRGKERRFFTKHLYSETLPKMISELYKNVGEGR
jgi:hypothetical protein